MVKISHVLLSWRFWSMPSKVWHGRTLNHQIRSQLTLLHVIIRLNIEEVSSRTKRTLQLQRQETQKTTRKVEQKQFKHRHQIGSHLGFRAFRLDTVPTDWHLFGRPSVRNTAGTQRNIESFAARKYLNFHYLEEFSNLNLAIFVQIDFVEQFMQNTFVNLLVVFLKIMTNKEK